MDPQIPQKTLFLIKKRFDQCISALETHKDNAGEKLKPGTLWVLMKYLNNNILLPLSSPDKLPGENFGPQLLDMKRDIYEDVGSLYSRWASVYGTEEEGLFRLEESVLIPLIGDLEDKKVLDIGCGCGRYSLKFALAGAEVTGIDLTGEMLERARSQAEELNLKIRFIELDIFEVDLENDYYDLIFSSLAVTHIENLAGLLGKLKPALSKSGRIIISDIHPCFKMMGAGVGFIEDDTFYEVKHHTHRISHYFEASRKTGLTVDDVIEFSQDTVLPFMMAVVLKLE